MTDLELTEAMLLRNDIEFEYEAPSPREEQSHSFLIVRGGYMGFYTRFEFDKNGKLDSISAYE